MAVDIVVIIVLLFFGFIYLLYWYFTKEFDYWKDKNVPFLEPVFLFGSVKNEMLNRTSWLSFINKCYFTFKSHGFGGVFFVRRPSVWFCDPKLIEKVLVEDFAYFHDRWMRKGDESPERNTLLFSKGEDWRSLRLKLAPAFASRKVKGMFQQISSSSDHLLRRIIMESDLRNGIDVGPLSTDFAIEILASCLCGVQMSNPNEAAEFKRALCILYKPSVFQNIVLILYVILPPKLLKYCGIQMSPQKAVNILSNVIKSILNHRKQNRTRRDDILQMMLDLKEQEEKKSQDMYKDKSSLTDKIKNLILGYDSKPELFFTEETIAAQILGFMSGGIKPISVTITLALFEIAKNPKIQNKLQTDIDLVLLKHKDLNMDALREMTYLDQVIQETLRLYSVNSLLMRSVSQKYKIPGTDVTLDEDMQVFIPLDGLHKDPDFYPCPMEFRPERWAGNNYRSSSIFLPFGHGPRICISIRLAVLTMKLCLVRLLKQHRVSISPRMKLPLQFDQKGYYKVDGGVWLLFQNRKI